MPLLTTFNYFLEEGFPEALTTGVVHVLFILPTLIEYNKAKKKSLYCCFVDFKKAFDTMPRGMLWQVLAGLRVEGCFLPCL
jgi:hypothetical protein